MPLAVFIKIGCKATQFKCSEGASDYSLG